jgi:hypothetical protein
LLCQPPNESLPLRPWPRALELYYVGAVWFAILERSINDKRLEETLTIIPNGELGRFLRELGPYHRIVSGPLPTPRI